MTLTAKQLDEMERQERARHSSNGYTYPDHYGFIVGTWPKLLKQARAAARLCGVTLHDPRRLEDDDSDSKEALH